MSKNNVSVEIFYDGVWNDVTLDDQVFTRNNIIITQGQATEYGGIRPCNVTLTLDNRTDKWRTSNPMSPIYRKVGRNTPIRVSVDGSVRVIAEINSWKCDQTQDFKQYPARGRAWTDVNASGTLFRVNNWNKTVRSPIYRDVIEAYEVDGYDLAEYWDMEIAQGSEEAPSSIGGISLKPVVNARYTLPDGSILPPGGAPDFGKGEDVPGSDPLPNFQAGGTLAAPIRTTSFNGYAVDWVMCFKANTDEGGTTSASVISWQETGTYVYFEVNVVKNNVTVFHANAADRLTLTNTGSTSANFDMYDGVPHHFRYQVQQNGGDYQAELLIDSGLYATGENFATPGAMAGNVGSPKNIEFNPLESVGDFMPTSIGHLAIWADGTNGGQPPTFFATNGWKSQRTANRLFNLLTYHNISSAVGGTTADSSRMNIQKSMEISEMMKQIRDTEDSLIFDDLQNLRIIQLLRNGRYRQNPVMTLYPDDLKNVPKEVTDNTGIFNTFTVKQSTGGQATAIDSSSFLGTQDPPDGIGTTEFELTVNIDDPIENLPQYANWRMRRATVDRPRYPEVVLDLNAKPELIPDFENLTVGSVIELLNFREDTIRLFVLGWTETIGTHSRIVVLNCMDDQQFYIGEYNSTDSRYDSGSTTVEALTTTETLWDISTTNPGDVWSSTTPYDVIVNGEVCTVTNCTTASGSGPYTQTMTCIRSVNGVVKEHALNSEVHVYRVGRYAL